MTVTPIKALIFDMDGILLDSEPLYLKANLSVVAAHGGFMSEQEYDSYIGIGTQSFYRIVKKRFGFSKSLEDLLAMQEKIYLEIAREEIRIFPEMVKLAEWVVKQGLGCAIASGSSRKVIEELTALTDIRNIFSCIVSSDEVSKGKPEPDVFLEAAKRLGTTVDECLVIEDSPFGVEAARRAGILCAAVPQAGIPDPNSYLQSAEIQYLRGMGTFSCEDLIGRLADRISFGAPVSESTI